jgi:MoaA/NifB/PqqE/SkfB family radical SAM enzyme
MYSIETIRRCHVELTTGCNASCPQCPRNYPDGSRNENLPDAELGLQYFKNRMPHMLFQSVVNWEFCGNYGDPAMAFDSAEILHHIRSKNSNTRLVMHTNGALRSSDWWRRLAGDGVECIFGIDGLQDTHHLYRRRTNWHKVIANASAFISAGGRATWQFIVFEHNQHQVEGCLELAQILGFEKFLIRKTNRFLRPKGGLAAEFPIPPKPNQGGYVLRPPTDERYRNPSVAGQSTSNGYDAALCAAAVTCSAQRDREIYISATGHVFPCCYLGHIHLKGQPPGAHELLQILSDRGLSISELDSTSRPIAEILSGSVFQNIIPDSWDADAPGRILKTCRRICGLERQAFDVSATKEVVVLKANGD